MFRKHKWRQNAKCIDEFGGMTDLTLEQEEGSGYAADDKQEIAFAVSINDQVLDKETGEYIQFVTAWSCIPINLTGEPNSAKLTRGNIEALAASVDDSTINKVSSKKKKDHSAWLARSAFLCVVATILLVAIRVISAVFGG